MKFLYLITEGNSIDLAWSLIELGHTVNILQEYKFDPLNTQPNDYEIIEHLLHEMKYDYVISQLFIPQAAEVCNKRDLIYISWTYDSPLLSLFADSVHYDCNRLFIFDKAQCEYLQSKSVKHVYYLPMATNTSRTGGLDISAEDEQIFSHNISFIGTLYEDNGYNLVRSKLSSAILDELNDYLKANICQWHKRKTWPCLSDSSTHQLINIAKMDIPHGLLLPENQYAGIYLLSRKLAEIDRTTILNTLATLNLVDLYTSDQGTNLVNVAKHPRIDYNTGMNKVFYLSKINLNITLPSIETGIPQRVFDIMGSGGFVLTNYQEELDLYFKAGKHLEVYHSIEELVDKAAYYLAHEDQRLRIAINGYKEIVANHTYLHRTEQLLNILKGETT